jgi:ketosteroid isomerase-like protein
LRRPGSLIRTFTAIALLTWSFGARALAAKAQKAELTRQEHKCLAAPTIDGVMQCYDTSDALILYDAVPPREFDGPKAVRADLQPVYGNFKSLKYEFLNEHVVTEGKLGVTYGVVHFSGTDKGGKPVDLTWRATSVWRKENGKWKIIHQHLSFPVDAATGKADIKSKP